MRAIMKNISDSFFFYLTCLLVVIAATILVLSFEFSLISSVIIVHVILGGLAFLIGGIALLSKKGSSLHKSSGRIFYVSMVVSVAMTLVVSLLPNYLSPSLFQIGILSLYFLIGGKRSIKFKQANHSLLADRTLALSVISISLLVMSLSLSQDGSFHPLRTVFGSIGIVFGLFDLYLFKYAINLKTKWLALHLSKMIGGYTAAVTAFFVAQNILPGYYNWFTPTVFGLSYIAFWLIKLKVFKPRLASQAHKV
jgi:uncharacterized membrane protein